MMEHPAPAFSAEALRPYPRKLLNAALYKLSPIHREVLNLAYMEGLSQREIAHRTKTPLGTVKSRTTAALRVLRERMNHDEEQYNRDE